MEGAEEQAVLGRRGKAATPRPQNSGLVCGLGVGRGARPSRSVLLHKPRRALLTQG